MIVRENSNSDQVRKPENKSQLTFNYDYVILIRILDGKWNKNINDYTFN